jgi:hypothetical protein
MSRAVANSQQLDDACGVCTHAFDTVDQLENQHMDDEGMSGVLTLSKNALHGESTFQSRNLKMTRRCNHLTLKQELAAKVASLEKDRAQLSQELQELEIELEEHRGPPAVSAEGRVPDHVGVREESLGVLCWGYIVEQNVAFKIHVCLCVWGGTMLGQKWLSTCAFWTDVWSPS